MDEQGRKLIEGKAGGHDARRKSEVRPPKPPEKQHPPGLQDYRDGTPETSVSGVFVFSRGVGGYPVGREIRIQKALKAIQNSFPFNLLVRGNIAKDAVQCTGA